MKKFNLFISFTIATALCIVGCKKTSTPYRTDNLTDYMLLQSGRSITYRLDSTTFTFYGQNTTITSYIVKDVIDTIVADNLGRPSWRVFRYITDTAYSQPWANLETYLITPTLQTIEVDENNLRYIKLAMPLDNGFSWQGNSYINTTPQSPDDIDYSYLDGWNYTYDSIGSPYTVLAGTIDSTLIVRQQDEALGDPTDLAHYSERNYSIEVYAKGIGLIYKDFLHETYQPPGTSPAGFKTGYGIRLNMIGHD
ncbi:MAG TPA: hypothetical protein VKT28_21500 [Puia sp.]|nr:hypothetical protein [Puia sp.]